jgi:hypothetical protein
VVCVRVRARVRACVRAFVRCLSLVNHTTRHTLISSLLYARSGVCCRSAAMLFDVCGAWAGVTQVG